MIAGYGCAGFGYIITATFLPVIARQALPGSPWLDLFWPIFGLGVIVGAMFLVTGIQQFVISTVVEGWKWLWILFGVFFVLAGIWALLNPGATTAALADSLGFLFLLVAVFWIIEAFSTRGNNDLWWLGLLSGIIMLVLSFWVAGQFMFERVYILLVFAGIWAMLQGVTDIIRAFQLKRLGKLITG